MRRSHATRKEMESLQAENRQLHEENRTLRTRYLELYETAEAVSDAALIPGICRPTRRGESGERRLIVATRPLDRLVDVLLGEAFGEAFGEAPRSVRSGMEED